MCALCACTCRFTGEIETSKQPRGTREQRAGSDTRGCPQCIEVNLITFTKLSHNHGAPPAGREYTVSASRQRDPLRSMAARDFPRSLFYDRTVIRFVASSVDRVLFFFSFKMAFDVSIDPFDIVGRRFLRGSKVVGEDEGRFGDRDCSSRMQ